MKKLIFKTLSEESTELVFEIHPKTWLEKTLIKFRIKKNPTAKLLIKPMYMGTRFRCMKYLSDIPNISDIDKDTPIQQIDIIVSKRGELLIQAVACMIHNQESEIPESIIDTIKIMDINTFNTAIQCLKEGLQTESFINSIISVLGMSLQTEEIIAPENESPVHTK